MGFRVTQGHRKWHHLIEHIRLLFIFHSNYASISYRFRDIVAYWSKIATPPLYLAPPLGVTPPDLRNDPWWPKTRMMRLSDGERISMIRSAVLIQYTRVTDGRTDRWTDIRTELAWHIHAMAYMLSRIKMSWSFIEMRKIHTFIHNHSPYNFHYSPHKYKLLLARNSQNVHFHLLNHQ